MFMVCFLADVMILADLGQRSNNLRTIFTKYTDSILTSFGANVKQNFTWAKSSYRADPAKEHCPRGTS